MKIDIKDTTKEPREHYELGKLYKDDDGDVFYIVRDGRYFNLNYLTTNGDHLATSVIAIGSSFQSIQEAVEGACLDIPTIPEIPVPAKKITIEF